MIERAVVGNLRIPWVRYAPLWPYLRWALFGVGFLYCALAIAGLAGIGGCKGGEVVACDASAYYYAPSELYGTRAEGVPYYAYSPAFAALIAPLRLLSFDAFVWVWFGLHIAALLYLRAGWFLAIPGINEDVIRGNVTVFIALAAVVGMRYGSAWAFPLLTKVLPGVGIVWHLARREWGHLAWASGATVGIVAAGVIVHPDLWSDWFAMLAGASDHPQRFPLVLRLPIAVAIVAYAGLTSRSWLVPVGMLMAWSFISPPVLMVLAAIPLLRQRGRDVVLLEGRSRQRPLVAHHAD
jgi:hypothetical protein